MTAPAPRPQPQPHWDLVRQRHIDALQRRAAQHQGLARQVIDARLLQLQTAPLASRPVWPAAESTVPAGHKALSDLLHYIAKQTAPAGELKAVHDYRGTWARLGMEQRLRQTGAQVPHNAGPLNTQRLLHQALTVMRQASPDYFQHFMAHVEGLLALDTSNQTLATVKPQASRRVRKPPAMR